MKKKSVNIKSNHGQYQDLISSLYHPVLWRAGIEEIAREHRFSIDQHPNLQFEPWFSSFVKDGKIEGVTFSLADFHPDKLYFFAINAHPDDAVFVFSVSTKDHPSGERECVITFHYIARLWDSAEPLFNEVLDQVRGYPKISVSCHAGGDIDTITYEGLSFNSLMTPDFGYIFWRFDELLRSHAIELFPEDADRDFED